MDNRSGISNWSMDHRRLFADQVYKQYEQTVFGTMATLLNSILLVFILRAHVAHINLLIWLACAVAVSAGRLVVYWRYKKSQSRDANPRKWNFMFNVTLFLSGLLWGSAAVFLFPTDSVGPQAFIAFVTGGMAAGAVSAFTAVLPAFFIFSVPALLPIIIRFFLLGDEIHIAMGAMVLLFLLLISLTAKRMNWKIRSLLALKYERGALIEHLQQEVQQRKLAQENLRQQKERVEEIVARRTAQLENANQRLKAILNGAPLVLWAIDPQGVISFVDGTGARQMGFVTGEAVGESIFELCAENVELIGITQRVINGEFISETVDYKDISYEVRYQPLLNEKKQLAGAIGVAIDVTEQTAAKQALSVSEEKYRELVENINDVIYAIDKEGTITYVSPVIEAVLGYRAEALVGTCFFKFIDNQDQARVKKDFSLALTEVRSRRDYRFLDKDGEIKWCRVNSRPVLDGDETVGIQGVLADISWSKRLEEQLQQSQKMEALGILAGGVAHDLNNILSGLISYPELLLMNMSEDNPLWRPLNTIKQSGENAAAVVQDLLTLGRRGVPTVELLNLNHLVKRCIESPEIKSMIAEHPEIELTTQFKPKLLNLYGSSIHIFTTITNLIINAVEAMPDGGHIEIATDQRYTDKVGDGTETVKAGEYVILSIHDTGIGITESDQARIFEPFYTKKVMGRSGSGLGMAVVWGTVKDHHGHIDLQSQAGEGTRFDLYFPATKDHLGPSDDEKKIPDYFGNGEFVLIVDDMLVQREVVTSILDRLGYRSHSVASGEEAVAYLESNQADLLILDMIMDPGMDGYETYCKIQKVRPGQKAIIASGYSESERVRQAQALGAGPYLKKPYSLSVIGKLIKEALAS